MPIQNFYIGNLQATIEAQDKSEDGGYLDSKVTIDGETVCWISWPEKDKFIQEITDVFNKYRI